MQEPLYPCLPNSRHACYQVACARHCESLRSKLPSSSYGVLFKQVGSATHWLGKSFCVVAALTHRVKTLRYQREVFCQRRCGDAGLSGSVETSYSTWNDKMLALLRRHVKGSAVGLKEAEVQAALLESIKVDTGLIAQLRQTPQRLVDGTHNPRWLAARRWRLTASQFHSILAVSPVETAKQLKLAESMLAKDGWWYRDRQQDSCAEGRENLALRRYQKQLDVSEVPFARNHKRLAASNTSKSSALEAGIENSEGTERTLPPRPDGNLQGSLPIAAAEDASKYMTVSSGLHGMLVPKHKYRAKHSPKAWSSCRAVGSRLDIPANHYTTKTLAAAESAALLQDSSLRLHVASVGALVSEEDPWLAASPDGIVIGPGGRPVAVLEVKSWRAPLTRNSPTWLQVQGSMAIASASFASPIRWCGVITSRGTTHVPFDGARWPGMREKLRRFYQAVFIPTAAKHVAKEWR